jgi:SulP family sulfate permease
LAGLPPIYGLYAGIVPLIIYAIFGTSRQLSVGPVALISLLILTGLAKFAEPGSSEFIQLSITVALIAGIIQMLLGLFRLGFLVNFLSHPVISGFTSAAAFIIGISQLQNLLGFSIPNSNKIHVIILSLAENIGKTNLITLGIGIFGVLFITWIKSINKKLPSGLFAVIIGILAVYLLQLHEFGVQIVGEVPTGLPPFAVPQLNEDLFRQLLPLSFTICLISFIESLAIAKALEERHKDYKIVPNQELLALGLSKIGGAFFQSFPTTGSFTRSAINDEAGAKTGMSSIISAAIIAIFLLLFTPLFYYLPKTILASVVIVAVYSLIDYKEAIFLWKNDKRDFISLLVTFFLTLTLGIQDGVFIGVILSLAIIIYRNSRPHVAVLGRLPNTTLYRNVKRYPEAICDPGVLIMRFDAPLYFGNASYFQKQVEETILQSPEKIKIFVLDAQGISDLDSSGGRILLALVLWIKNQGIDFRISGAIGPIRDLLARFGITDALGEDGLYLSVQSAVEGNKNYYPTMKI